MLNINLDLSEVKDINDYRDLWKHLGKIELKMVEKHEECPHNLGDVFIYETPNKRPVGVCNALLHVLDLYTWRVALGFPSWNEADWKVYRIHCPDSLGTVWEMRKIVKEDGK